MANATVTPAMTNSMCSIVTIRWDKPLYSPKGLWLPNCYFYQQKVDCFEKYNWIAKNDVNLLKIYRLTV